MMKRARFNMLLAVLGAAAVCAALVGLFAQTWVRMECVNTGYMIAQERQVRDRLRSDYEMLRMEVARLEAPDRVIAIAQRFGLTQPKTEQIYLISIPAAAEPAKSTAP